MVQIAKEDRSASSLIFVAGGPIASMLAAVCASQFAGNNGFVLQFALICVLGGTTLIPIETEFGRSDGL